MHALVRNGNCIFAKILHNGATAKEHGRFFTSRATPCPQQRCKSMAHGLRNMTERDPKSMLSPLFGKCRKGLWQLPNGNEKSLFASSPLINGQTKTGLSSVRQHALGECAAAAYEPSCQPRHCRKGKRAGWHHSFNNRSSSKSIRWMKWRTISSSTLGFSLFSLLSHRRCSIRML